LAVCRITGGPRQPGSGARRGTISAMDTEDKRAAVLATRIERARVVAYLRELAVQDFTESVRWERAAAAIEAGEHAGQPKESNSAG
jgi:hypothetical protein